MDLLKYLMKRVKVTATNGKIVEGLCHSFIGKADTEDGLYDEIFLETDKYPYFAINESEIKTIEIID